MNNVIRLRPIVSNYAEMSKEQLLVLFEAWASEPGIQETYTRDWLTRGFDLLPAMHAVAMTQELKEVTKAWYKLCLKVEQNQNGFDAS